ncbi:MAG: hypothetical protein LAO21_13715 [Acidobacteriia bacterium]|nr:hypothetical protein [Terriglobia bacterium]
MDEDGAGFIPDNDAFMKGCEFRPTGKSIGFSFAVLATKGLASRDKREVMKYRKEIFYQLSVPWATVKFQKAGVDCPWPSSQEFCDFPVACRIESESVQPCGGSDGLAEGKDLTPELGRQTVSGVGSSRLRTDWHSCTAVPQHQGICLHPAVTVGRRAEEQLHLQSTVAGSNSGHEIHGLARGGVKQTRHFHNNQNNRAHQAETQI